MHQPNTKSWQNTKVQQNTKSSELSTEAQTDARVLSVLQHFIKPTGTKLEPDAVEAP